MARIVPITPESIEAAARELRAGRLVAFPTETVYGLGADACNDRAVAAIFAAKERPRFNPLIVHVPDRTAAKRLVAFNDLAHRLASCFWPGALTLVLPRRPDCPLSLLVSAGLDTAAVRVPAHEGALELLCAAGTPVAAPSANPSGRLSPTSAAHVASALGDRVAMILDGGQCAIGLESTVLDLSGDEPTILRPGGVTAEALAAALGRDVSVSMESGDESGDGRAPHSPGMLVSHYAPRLPVRLGALSAGPGEALLGFGPDAAHAALNLSPSGDLVEAAANLFAHLHALDSGDYDAIAIMPIPEEGIGRAINDRLRRAAAERPRARR